MSFKPLKVGLFNIAPTTDFHGNSIKCGVVTSYYDNRQIFFIRSNIHRNNNNKIPGKVAMHACGELLQIGQVGTAVNDHCKQGDSLCKYHK